MKRRVVAAVWITGATVPLLLAVVFLFGCCVLPFHHGLHKLMPICQFAASVLRAEPSGHHEHSHDAVPASPGREKQAPVKRIATEVPQAFRLAAVVLQKQILAPASTTAYRSFITLGAVRCDWDVGLNVLGATFLI
jgi:hypothetical protein